MEKNISPSPKKITEMDFPSAMREIITGKKITKLEWDDRSIYGELKDGFLMLRKEDGKYYQWIISEADIRGEDFVVVT